MAQTLDWDALVDPTSKRFLQTVQISPSRVSRSQLGEYFQVMIDNYYEVRSRDVKKEVLLAICRTISKGEKYAKKFGEQFLPSLGIDEMTLNVVYLMAERLPSSLNAIEKEIEAAIATFPKQILWIICVYSQKFEEMDNPWPIVELLLSHVNEFKVKELAEDYVSLLAYLVNLSDEFCAERGQECWDAICEVMQIKNEDIVIRCYAALTKIADTMGTVDNFPTALVCRHLRRVNLQRSCVSLLLHTQPKKVTENLVASLLVLAQKELKVTLVLMKMASVRSNAQVLLANTEWLTWKLPTPIDTMRLFAVILGHKMLRPQIAEKPQIPQFLLNLLDLSACEILNVICTFMRRLPLTVEIVQNMSDCGLFQSYFEMSLENENMGVVQSGLLVANTVAKVAYVTEFDYVVEQIVSFVRNKSAMMSIALTVGVTLCRYSECIAAFKRNRFESLLRRRQQDESLESLTRKFLAHMEKRERRK